jgi:hypothetical protein
MRRKPAAQQKANVRNQKRLGGAEDVASLMIGASLSKFFSAGALGRFVWTLQPGINI